MPTAIERRTQAFYEWETCGRGWNTYTNVVQLEPPFQAFSASDQAAAIIDDGRRPTFFERLSARLNQRHATPNATESHPAAPGPQPFAWAEPLNELELLVPADEKIDVATAVEWLRNAVGARSPIAFEIVCDRARVSLRFAVEARDVTRIREQTLAFFPAVKLRQVAKTTADLWMEADGPVVGAIEFGLAREFMLPLAEPNARIELLTPILAAFASLTANDAAIVQLIIEPVRGSWSTAALKAVTTPSGDPFFVDAPEITQLARKKCAQPFYAAVLRLAVITQETNSAKDVLLGVANALRSLGDSTRNELTPLPVPDIDQLIDDILARTSHRSGMILSLSDLANLVRPPSSSVRSPSLLRPNARTKAAPAHQADATFLLGANEHDGEVHRVGLTTSERLRHCYIIGASGTGKSTLLLSMIEQDIEQGNGLAVLDPHGDLIDHVVARVPSHRTNDVLLFDPSDDEFPVGFNILSAHSELERTLLSSDLVAVFRRLSTTFGDQMATVLGNAVAALLESDKGGTLLDLRRFLADKAFRASFLTTVRDQEVVSYWRHEFPLLKGNPHAPILTRLNTFLRPKPVRHMVAQAGERFNMRAIMDGRRILLARLSHGAIGEENAHLLGSLLVAKIAQTAMSRQDQPEASRIPFFVFIDEFHHFVTPSVAAILSGARKYALSLTLGHQDMRQLRSRSEDVMSAVLANAYTRVVFRVSDQDAKTLESGFSFFEAADLQNLGTGDAIARIERPNFDFNIRTSRVSSLDRAIAVSRRDAVLTASRAQYATSRADVETELRARWDEREGNDVQDDKTADERVVRRSKSPSPTASVEEDTTAPLPGRGGHQHKYLQQLVRHFAEERGFQVASEKSVLGGHGHIDVTMSKDGLSVACEICVTTRPDHEVGNLTKCLAAGFDYAVLVSTDTRLLDAARRLLAEPYDERVRFFLPHELPTFLDALNPSLKAQTQSQLDKANSGTRESSVSGNNVSSNDAAPLGKKRLLIARDAAAYLGMATQSLAKLRWAGTSPPFYKVGRQVLYDHVDLDAWLAVRRRRSTSDVHE